MRSAFYLLLIPVLFAASPQAETPQSPAERPVRPPSPMMIEIQSALESEQVELQKLYQQLAGTADSVAALEIQKSIDQLKRGGERTLLQIQLRHAQMNGNAAAVDALTKAIAAFDQPRERRQPVERED